MTTHMRIRFALSLAFAALVFFLVGCRHPVCSRRTLILPQAQEAINFVPTPVGQIAFTIKGDVHHPGRYFLAQGASLSEALHQAGGFTDFAYLKKIKITHRDGAVAYCNFRKEGTNFVMADEDSVGTISRAF